MKQTGDLLKQARENAKLSVSEVALSTKINPKILTAIENGDSTNLPAKTFLKGFVRSYALYLKMDADEVMKVFQSETGATPAPTIDKEVIRQAHENVVAEKPAPKQRRVGDDESFSGLRAVAVVVIVVLIGVIIGVRELVEKYQREKVVDAATELKVSPLEAPDKDETKSKVGSKSEDKVVAETPRMLMAPPEAPAPAKTEAKPEEPKPEEAKSEAPTPPPAPATAGAKPADIKPEQPAAAAPPPPPAVKPSKNEIILEALDKVEVKFKLHGQAKVVSLAPSQVHTILSDESVVLDLSDGGAVNIIHNGRERGVPGDLGKPKQVTIP